MRRPLPSLDSSLLLLAAVAAVSSAIGCSMLWFWPKNRLPEVRTMPSSVASVRPFVPRARQEWGRSNFDLFAPREVVTNTDTEPAPATLIGVELVAIRAEPFRLRLIGIVGDGRGRRGAFENAASGEVFLAAAGEMMPGERLRIEAIDSGGVTSKASVRSLDSDRVLELTIGEPAFTGEWIATVREGGVAREVHAGDDLMIDDDRYRIESISGTSVRMTKEVANGSMSERRELQLLAEKER